MHVMSQIIIDNRVYNATNRPTEIEKHNIIDFIYHHLEGGNPRKEHIRKAIEYAIKEQQSFGGFIIIQKMDGELAGVTVINKTGMEGYMAENILVYLAVSKQHRGSGVAQSLLNQILNHAKGDIGLQINHNNRLIKVFEKIGFKKSKTELRLTR